MKGTEREKNIRVLIVGVIAYTLLHAVMFVGGRDSLLYNLTSYFWIALVLDVIINLLTNESLVNDITKAFPILKGSNENDDDEPSEYRLIVPTGKANEIEENTISNSNSNTERKKERPKSRRKKASKREVSFSNPLTTEQNNGNPYVNKIPDRDVPTIEKLLEQKLMNGEVGSKSTPLNQLNQFNQTNLESGFSDSDSDFTTDMDGDFSNFERGLSF